LCFHCSFFSSSNSCFEWTTQVLEDWWMRPTFGYRLAWIKLPMELSFLWSGSTSGNWIPNQIQIKRLVAFIFQLCIDQSKQ
jgi:hypothetical protein